jgi:hypothetical protein
MSQAAELAEGSSLAANTLFARLSIVIANDVSLPPLDVTLDELYLALAKEVPNGETGAAFELGSDYLKPRVLSGLRYC